MIHMTTKDNMGEGTESTLKTDCKIKTGKIVRDFDLFYYYG